MVFDDELEFDRETQFADCRVFSSEGGVVLFENPEGTVRGETLQSRLQFYRLPTGLQKISVSIDSDVRLRLSHAVCDVPYLLSGTNGLSPAPGRIAVRYNVAHPTAALSLSRTLRFCRGCRSCPGIGVNTVAGHSTFAGGPDCRNRP